jgi:hypothetical protein
MSLDLPDGTPLPPLEAKAPEQVAAEIKDCTYSWTAFLDGWLFPIVGKKIPVQFIPYGPQ